MAKAKLNFIDVFSGAGGLSCGLEMTGMRCLLGVDVDSRAMQTFSANHKYANIFSDDISNLSSDKLSTLTQGQKIHLVAGGPPCQGFSTVGLGDPKDKRNSLFMQFVRIVKIAAPEFVLIENVTGLLAKKNEKTLKDIFRQFQNLGYHLDVQVMSSENYGVPEKRRRTIILGSRLSCKIEFPVPTHNIMKNGKLIAPITVGDALKSLHTSEGNVYNHDIDSAAIKNQMDKKRLSHIPEGAGIRYRKDEMAYLPRHLRLKVDWDALPENRFRQTKYQRLDEKRPSPTIMTHRHSYYHPKEDRYLTQREAAAIQSFPSDFHFFGNVSSQWRQIGNAVPPLLGKALGQAILKMYRKSHQENHQIQRQASASKIKSIREKAFVYKERQ